MIVLDASVIAKWFLEEQKSSSALYYRDLHFRREEIIIAPDIVIYELANLFRYKKDFGEKEIISVFDALEKFKIEIVHLSLRDVARAAIFAKQRDTTVYDAIYVIVALNFGCKFITADEKFYKKVKNLNFVELL